MSGSVSHGAKAEPNLTPILDLVFQLITFFMLVINFKSQELDLSLKLPVVGSSRPVATEQAVLVLNVSTKGELTVYGAKRPDVAKYIQNEARADRAAAKRRNPSFGKEDALPTIIVIRADKKTPFKQLFSVIKTCQDNGYRDFALKALMNKIDQQ
jgi:biopolymer transport protein ExbD